MQKRTTIKQKRSGRFQISEIDLAFSNLPEELAGYCMVQLSDLHFGSCTSIEHIKEAVNLANNAKPDLVLLTGDYVQYGATGIRHKLCTHVSPQLFNWFQYRRRVRELTRELAPVLASITAPDGMFAVAGNHDYLEGIGTIYRQFPSCISWINNSSLTIEKDNSKIVIAGLDDIKKGQPDIKKMLAFFSPNEEDKFQVNICLSHNPDITIMPGSEGLSAAHLILSGHTHGGQIRLPFLRPLITRTTQKQHVRGLTFHQETPIYVTHGVGYGTMPIRLFCPPEITVIRLIKCQF